MKNEKNKIVENLILYKTISNLDPVHVKTKGSGLTGSEIDGNMLFLHGEQIKEISFDLENNKLDVKRFDSAKDVSIDLPKIGDSTLEFKDGKLIFSSPSGEINEIDGLFNDETLKIEKDGTLNGNGNVTDPLKVSSAYISGDLGSVSYLIATDNDPETIAKLTEPDDSYEMVYDWARAQKGFEGLQNTDRIIVPQKAYPCEGVDSIVGIQYVLFDGGNRRVMKTGEYVTLISSNGQKSERYTLGSTPPSFEPRLIKVLNRIDPEDKILSLKGESSLLATNLAIKRGKSDTGEEIICLVGKDGVEISRINIGDLIISSFLKSTDIVTEDGKLYLIMIFDTVNEEGEQNEKAVKIDLTELVSGIQDDLLKQINDLKETVENNFNDLNDKISALTNKFNCLDKQVVKTISGTGNEIKVSRDPKNNNSVNISFDDDTYFIAGE